MLTLFAFNSARFFEIISELAFSFNKLSLTGSSSTLDGSTTHCILFLSKISFLTSLFEARIILFNIV